VELAREKPRFGYRRLHVLLGRAGEHVNHKRLHRVYREAGLMIRRKKRKHCVRVGQPLLARTAANQEWALDYPRRAVYGPSGQTERSYHCRAKAYAEREGWKRPRALARGTSRQRKLAFAWSGVKPLDGIAYWGVAM
jgi:hypothetical protein